MFGADEQHDVAVDVARGSGSRDSCSTSERVIERFGADTEMSLLFVDEATIAELNERFLGGERPDRRARRSRSTTSCLPSGRQPDQGGRGPGTPSDPGDPPDAAR